uniref:Regulator of cell cycle RGCC n=1 Tax=Otus sunia TaxID=257818 RepID=A0A8C8AWB9_9STRI
DGPGRAGGTPLRAAPGAAAQLRSMADELSDLLREFDEVMEDFDRGPACQYEQHLEELKKKAGHNVYDSGIDELESNLNSSEEDLNTPANAYLTVCFSPLAKLGDTQELEEFIADLDKVVIWASLAALPRQLCSPVRLAGHQ